MRTYHFESELLVDAPREEVFQFFAKAQNLEQITPDSLRFEIITPLPIIMAKGVHIEYRLKIYAVPFYWLTEITLWEPPDRFIDSQLKGPYRSWVHEHIFTEVDGKCLIKDNISYQVRGGIFAPLINRMFVRKDVTKIFNFRSAKILTVFPPEK